MENRDEKVKRLEKRNGELAKEILLNESAVYETEKEISEVDQDLLDHPEIQKYINNLRLLIERIQRRNKEYKKEIYQNNLEIKKLK